MRSQRVALAEPVERRSKMYASFCTNGRIFGTLGGGYFRLVCERSLVALQAARAAAAKAVEAHRRSSSYVVKVGSSPIFFPRGVGRLLRRGGYQGRYKGQLL